MTQQLDLMFNTTGSMEKMMNSSTSFSGKDQKASAEFDSQFSSYLNDANKSFKNDKNTVDYSKNNNQYEKKEVKYEEKQGYSDKNNTAENNSSKYEYEDSKTTVERESVHTAEDAKDSNKAEVSNENVVVENTSEEVLNEQQMDEMLQDSMLNASLNNSQVVSKEDIEKLEQTLAISVENDSDFTVDALKSGVQFENMIVETNIETVENVDLQSVEAAMKEVVVSKDDFIKAMYNSQISDDKEVKPILDADLVVKAETLKVEDLVAKNNSTVESEKVLSEQESTEDLLKVADLTKVDAKADIVDSSKDLKQQQEVEMVSADKFVEKVSNDEVIKGNVEVKEVVLDKDSVADSEKLSLKDEVKSVDNIELQQDVKTQQNENILLAKDANLQTKVDMTALQSEVVKTIKTTENSNATDKNIVGKMEELNEEISSAKLENMANMAQKSDKTEADKNAKTNVDAKDTMNIKEDVSGIEFKNQKSEEIVADSKISEQQADKIKNRVENVKIQVEENVKAPEVQQNMTDAAKIAKANETLEKAGLSTENLKKMDGKIKDIDYSSNQNAQTDLGQSYQEMMMRDMMQGSTQSATQNQSELKVDFTQALNKAHNANNQQLQAQQDAQEVDILEQIRTRMTASGKNGLQKITIGLTPESLGKLNIEIAKGQNGISAQILADNPQAKEILEKNLDGLKSILQSQGVNVNNVNVKVAEASRSSDSDNNMFQNNDNQFDSNNKGGNSKNSDDTNKEKHSDFEILQNTVLKKDQADDVEDVISRTSDLEKTVSIKGGLGKVSYKM